MKLKDISPYQKIRALVANKLTLPLTVLKALNEGQKVNKKNLTSALNELERLKRLIAFADKEIEPKIEELLKDSSKYEKL